MAPRRISLLARRKQLGLRAETPDEAVGIADPSSEQRLQVLHWDRLAPRLGRLKPPRQTRRRPPGTKRGEYKLLVRTMRTQISSKNRSGDHTHSNGDLSAYTATVGPAFYRGRLPHGIATMDHKVREMLLDVQETAHLQSDALDIPSGTQ